MTKEKKVTPESVLKEGNEGHPLRMIIDNLTDDQILNAMQEYSDIQLSEKNKEIERLKAESTVCKSCNSNLESKPKCYCPECGHEWK